jgi:hypothetical protein
VALRDGGPPAIGLAVRPRSGRVTNSGSVVGPIRIEIKLTTSTCEGGIGIVIRDAKEDILLTAWKFIERGSDAEEVEALACAEDSCWRKDGTHLGQFWRRTASMVTALKAQGAHRSRLKFIMDEARAAGEGLMDWTVVHKRRESNGVAYELAQLAKRNRHSAVWRFVAPVFIEQLRACLVSFSPWPASHQRTRLPLTRRRPCTAPLFACLRL